MTNLKHKDFNMKKLLFPVIWIFLFSRMAVSFTLPEYEAEFYKGHYQNAYKLAKQAFDSGDYAAANTIAKGGLDIIMIKRNIKGFDSDYLLKENCDIIKFCTPFYNPVYLDGFGDELPSPNWIKPLSIAASHNIAEANFLLGLAYESSPTSIIKKDAEKAFALIQKAANAGHEDAQILLMHSYQMGAEALLIKKDAAQYKKWQQMAQQTILNNAQKGNILSQYAIYYFYNELFTEIISTEEAFAYLKNAADFGISCAKEDLAAEYWFKARIVSKNYESAIQEYTSLYEDDQNNLNRRKKYCALIATIYEEMKDYTNTIAWVRRLETLPITPTENLKIKEKILSLQLELPDYDAAYDTFQTIKTIFNLVRNPGTANYMNLVHKTWLPALGAFFVDKKDYLKAIDIYEFLYAQLNKDKILQAEFAFILGRTYREAEKYEDSIKWYYKAAELNEPTAMFNLAVAYQTGTGVLQSESAAIDWYYKAADIYLQCEDRDDALTAYDRMKHLDKNHILTKKLEKRLYD